MNEQQKKGSGPLRIVLALGAAGALAAALVVARSPGGEERDAGDPGFAVRRGPLTISVTESGTIKAREQIIIKNEVEGRTTILSLVPEGTRVKAGDLLIELDASRLADQKVDQEIRVMNSEAAFVRARENLEVVKNKSASDIDKSELEQRFAGEDLKKYEEGEFPKQVMEAEAKVALAEEELKRTEEKLKWSRVLLEEKYLSHSEMQADELAANKARLDLELAAADIELLRTFTYERELARLESDVKQNTMALERVRRAAAADIVQAGADLRAKESEFKQQKDKLRKLEEQIVKTRITAPADGLVVYATSAKATWRGNVEPLDEGQEVRERQELIYLPTAASFLAEVKVHESSLKKISLGLPARLTIDALPGLSFTGTVAKIAPLPDAQSIFLNPDLKVYRTEVHIDGDGGELRTGMSCRAEIVLTRFDDALQVPMQAVLRVRGEPTVYVRQGGDWVPRRVETGLDNNRLVRIVSGLREGEEVLLAPPLDQAAETEPEAGEPEKEKILPKAASSNRDNLRKRREGMSPEEREAAREKFQKERGGAVPGGAPER